MEKGAAIEKIPQGGNGETVPPKTKRCLTVLSAIRGEGGLIHGLAMNEEILVVGTLLVWRDNTPIKRCLTVLSVYEGRVGLKIYLGMY